MRPDDGHVQHYHVVAAAAPIVHLFEHTRFSQRAVSDGHHVVGGLCGVGPGVEAGGQPTPGAHSGQAAGPAESSQGAGTRGRGADGRTGTRWHRTDRLGEGGGAGPVYVPAAVHPGEVEGRGTAAIGHPPSGDGTAEAGDGAGDDQQDERIAAAAQVGHGGGTATHGIGGQEDTGQCDVSLPTSQGQDEGQDPGQDEHDHATTTATTPTGAVKRGNRRWGYY